jgi:hypothetical protein
VEVNCPKSDEIDRIKDMVGEGNHRLMSIEKTVEEHHVTLFGKDNRPGLKDRVLILNWESRAFWALAGVITASVAWIIKGAF